MPLEHKSDFFWHIGIPRKIEAKLFSTCIYYFSGMCFIVKIVLSYISKIRNEMYHTYYKMIHGHSIKEFRDERLILIHWLSLQIKKSLHPKNLSKPNLIQINDDLLSYDSCNLIKYGNVFA